MKNKKQFIKWLLRALFILNKQGRVNRLNPLFILIVFISAVIFIFPQTYYTIKEIND